MHAHSPGLNSATYWPYEQKQNSVTSVSLNFKEESRNKTFLVLLGGLEKMLSKRVWLGRLGGGVSEVGVLTQAHHRHRVFWCQET